MSTAEVPRREAVGSTDEEEEDEEVVLANVASAFDEGTVVVVFITV